MQQFQVTFSCFDNKAKQYTEIDLVSNIARNKRIAIKQLKQYIKANKQYKRIKTVSLQALSLYTY